MFSNTGYWNANQVTEWCGELIDTGHTTIRRLAKRFDLPLDNLLGAQPHRSDDIYHFFGGYYPKSRADRDFLAVSDTNRRRRRGGRLSHDVRFQHGGRASAGSDERLRVHRAAHSRGASLAARGAARRRLRHRVRRRFDRAVGAQPDFPARVSARCQLVVDLRRVRREVPHPRRQSAAARSHRPLPRRRRRQDGAAPGEDQGNRERPVQGHLRARRRHERRGRRLRGAGASVCGPERARHFRGGLRRPQAPGDRRTGPRPQRQAASSVRSARLAR